MSADVLQLVPRVASAQPMHRGAPTGTTAISLESEWKRHLRYNADGNMTKDVGNVHLILKNAPGFVGCLRHNVMTERAVWYRQPEFDVGIKLPKENSELHDCHAVYVQQVLAKDFKVSVAKDIVWSAMASAALESEMHPVQEYIDELKWDGKPRVSKWLHAYLNCDDTVYNSAIGRWWMISAVARAFRPGCQADHAIVLEGKQGYGKSQAVKALGDPWYLGSLPDIRDYPRAADAIAGKWIVEMAELDAIKGAGMTRIKDFLTQQVDRYRAPYARATLDRARSCVFIGTTNETNYLKDTTGARRFWPALVMSKIDVGKIEADRDQLWAETKVMFDSGDQWHPSQDYVETIEGEQEARREVLPWEAKIAAWVSDSDATVTTTDEVLTACIGKDIDAWNQADVMQVANCLKNLGFKQAKPYDKKLKKQVRAWVLDN